MEDNPSSLLINALRSTSYLLEAYGYNGRYPTLSEIQHMIARTIANLEDQDISRRMSSATLDRPGNAPHPEDRFPYT